MTFVSRGGRMQFTLSRASYPNLRARIAISSLEGLLQLIEGYKASTCGVIIHRDTDDVWHIIIQDANKEPTKED